MLLRTGENPVERIGVSSESEFTIVNNAKAFDILSSGLYTDPILAVVRELSCNAYDAHVEAGKKDVPFTVHLPSRLEPYFSVKDDGIGMSDEDVRGLYSTYFASTKTQTNEQIGAFGLGSKSPFSYSKAFDVIARWEGVKRTYSVFINEDGVPTIAELAKVDTIEGNGIEVKIAVQSHDQSTFQTKTAEALRYFPVKPTIVGRSGFEFQEVSELATITDKYIVTAHSYNTEITAVQGNVPYKVSVRNIDQFLSGACETFISNHTIVLFFDIGMLDIAASREEVRYDDVTAKNIADAIEVAFQDYLNGINDQINEMTKKGSRWDVYTLLCAKFSSSNSLKRIVGSFKFTSKLANDWIEGNGNINYDEARPYHRIVLYTAGTDRATKTRGSYNGFGENRQYYVKPAGNRSVVLNDVTKRGSLRLNELVSGRSYSGVMLVIVPISDRILAKAGLKATAKQREAEYKEIIKQLGNPTVRVLSECTDDVMSASGIPRKSGNTFKQFEDRHARRHSMKPMFNECEDPKGGLYLQIDLLRNLVVGDELINWSHDSLRSHLDYVLRTINFVNKTDYKVGDVYGITKKVVKSVSTDKRWSSLVEVYAKAFKELKTIKEFYERISKGNVLGIKYLMNDMGFRKMVLSLQPTSKFRTLVEPLIELSKEAYALKSHNDHSLDSDDFNMLSRFNETFGIKVKTKTEAYLNKKDFVEYVMLQHFDFSHNSSTLGDAKDYIELIEKQ